MADQNLGDLMHHCTNALEGLRTTLDAMQYAAIGMQTVAAEMNNIQNNVQGSVQQQLDQIRESVLSLKVFAKRMYVDPLTRCKLRLTCARTEQRGQQHSPPD